MIGRRHFLRALGIGGIGSSVPTKAAATTKETLLEEYLRLSVTSYRHYAGNAPSEDKILESYRSAKRMAEIYEAADGGLREAIDCAGIQWRSNEIMKHGYGKGCRTEAGVLARWRKQMSEFKAKRKESDARRKREALGMINGDYDENNICSACNYRNHTYTPTKHYKILTAVGDVDVFLCKKHQPKDQFTIISQIGRRKRRSFIPDWVKQYL